MVSEATTFRLDNIRTRSLKTIYKHLSPKEKQYIKLNEKLAQWQKEIVSFWRHIKRDERGRASQDNNWDFYHFAETSRAKMDKQIERFLLKNNWTEQRALAVIKYHRENNARHCYGGSF